MRAHAQGDAAAARDAYREALALAPEHPDGLNLLGTALLQLGQVEQALQPLQRAARALRHRPDVLANLAQAHFALGRFPDAYDLFRKANRLDPGQPQFRLGMANSLAMQGKLAEAEKLLRSLVEVRPNDPLAWFNLGNVVRDQEQLAEAEQCYRKALDLERGWIDARLSLGSALHRQYRFEDAEHEYRAALRTAPDHVPALYNLASVLIDAGRPAEAEVICRELVRRDPSSAQSNSFLGSALSTQGKLVDALHYHSVAAAFAPEDADLARSHAAALAAGGALDAALKEFARALALQPGSAPIRCSRGTVLLAHGRFAEGWADYACRPTVAALSEQHEHVRWHRTLDDIERGSRLLLIGEQGLGDELFFLRFVPRLSAAGVRVTYRASRKLRSLLERIDWLPRVMDDSTALAPDEGTATMLIGDLPHALALESSATAQARPANDASLPPETPSAEGRMPSPVPLRPLEAQIALMRRRLGELGDPPYLGLTWRGGTPPREQQRDWVLHKEAPLEALGDALQTFAGTILVLQRNPVPGEIERLVRAVARPVHDFSALNGDLETMLALLALIDEYVGVSNTNMHLRAGTGRRARVLVPCPAEWRWMAVGHRSPWFPDFVIYRQSERGDWSSALRNLGQDVAQAVHRRPE